MAPGPSEADPATPGGAGARSAPPLTAPCRQCGRSIGSSDNFCRFCGCRQQVTDPFYYHPAAILLLAFLVLGLVWRAREMGTRTKAVLTAVILVYTAITFYAAYAVVIAVYRELSILNDLL